MKQGRVHQRRSHQRNKTPSVICLPPPNPPLVQPRKEPEALRAFVLPQIGEPLADVPAKPQPNRETRRKTRTSKARKSSPKPAALKTAAVAANTADPLTPGPNPIAPLPRNMSLAMPRQSALTVVGRWLRSLVVKRRPVPVSISSAAAIAQITSLREEVARLQTTLDRLLDKATTA